MKKITITFKSDENLEYIQNILLDIVNSDNIVDLLPVCLDGDDNEVNYNIKEL